MASYLISLWRKRLTRIFDEQLRDLVINRHIMRQANDVWKRHKGGNGGGRLAQWMVQNYLAFATTTIRRLSEPPPEQPRKSQTSLSLVILLEDMAANHKLLSRRWYTGMYPKRIFNRDFRANRDFNNLCGNAKAQFMPERRIRVDIAAIKRAVRPIKRLVDKVVAHTEEDRRKKGRPKWGQINKAIDLLVIIYKRYHVLLTATAMDPFDVERLVNVTNDLERVWPRVKKCEKGGV